MKLIQHVGLVHNHERNFSITCGLNNCKSSFTIYESFRRRVYRKYRKLVLPHDDMDATEYMHNDALNVLANQRDTTGFLFRPSYEGCLV